MPNQGARNSHNNERRVNIRFVKKGMFISCLDRPWIDTPFWVQGFFLRTDKELDALHRYCHSVYINTNRGIAAEHYMEEELELPTSAYLEKAFIKKKHKSKYINKITLKEEFETAQDVLEVATEKFFLVMDNIEHGKTLGLKLIPSFIQPMVESIMRNSDALLLLIRLREKNNLIYYHAIDSCVMALAFGKFMGMPLDEINKLATGALLLDIGKVKISNKLLNKAETLTEKEYTEVCSHVKHGVQLLKKDKSLHEDIINMIWGHHERSNGSGYPNGLMEYRIPAFARIAGIIDCYNAMCSQRPYNQSYTPYDALQELNKLKEQHFQPEIVKSFMHCMGTYPNGSLVEFETGEVGIVLIQNYSNQDKPHVLLLLDSNKKAYNKFRIIDLRKKNEVTNGELLTVAKGLKANDYEINLSVIYKKLKIVLLGM